MCCIQLLYQTSSIQKVIIQNVVLKCGRFTKGLLQLSYYMRGCVLIAVCSKKMNERDTNISLPFQFASRTRIWTLIQENKKSNNPKTPDQNLYRKYKPPTITKIIRVIKPIHHKNLLVFPSSWTCGNWIRAIFIPISVNGVGTIGFPCLYEMNEPTTAFPFSSLWTSWSVAQYIRAGDCSSITRSIQSRLIHQYQKDKIHQCDLTRSGQGQMEDD